MDGDCVTGHVNIPDKEELFSCDYGDYEIRYSRWQDDADRYGYFDDHIADATTDEWRIGGTSAGQTWTSIDTRASEPRKYRWIATYQNWPYDVTVKGIDENAMKNGMDAVQAKPPDEIGLP
jgi:hypothetical protein